ncbi:MAG: GDSL-type esterase/lipase family protein [Coleofasciculaceae cyanobacterium]
MTDPYLLAAGLLTAGPIPVPPPPVLPLNLPDNLAALLASTAARTLQSVVNPKIEPVAETTYPEFSPEPLSSVELTHFSSELATSDQALPKPQPRDLAPVSGSQLYYQRMIALKAGKIYTSLRADSFQSFFSKSSFPNAAPLKKPTHQQWKLLLEQEAKAMSKGQGNNRLAILVGDSLSLWFPSELLPGGQFWLNQGISGENSSQILNRLSAFSQTRPSTIYIMAGTNDLRQGVTDQVILNNLRLILQRLRLNHPQAQIILQSILPTRLEAIPQERIRNLNQQIAIIAQQEGAGYLNLYTSFADEQAQLQRELTTDGIHLTQLGYYVWQSALNYAEYVMAAY